MRAWFIAGIVSSVLVLFTLVICSITAFYAEENWRGWHEWTNAKAEIESHGISFDRQVLLPKPVLDAQNFAAIPLLKSSQSATYPYSWRSPALDLAIGFIRKRIPSTQDEGNRPDYFPYSGPMQKIDPALMSDRIAKIGSELSPPIQVPSTASATEGLELLCPALVQLRHQNSERPACLFTRNFDRQPPYAPSFGPALTVISLFRVLSLEEQVALQENNLPVVIEDMQVGWKLLEGLAHEPYLVSGLTACVPIQLQSNVVAVGIDRHSFNESQLEQIESQLRAIDLLKDSRFWIIGDIVDYDLPYCAYYRRHRFVSEDEMEVLQGTFLPGGTKPTGLSFVAFWLTPSGWFRLDNAAYTRCRLLGTLEAFHPEEHRVYPNRLEVTESAMQKQNSWVFWDETLAGKSKMFPNTLKSFAFAQARLDEALIAIQLERYHLQYGKYPLKLGQLNGQLPCDVMSGEDYIYKLQANDTFNLYSVGWNQKDDGGSAPAQGEAQKDGADWLWPRMKD